jgi:hypothetical protein
MDQKLTQSVEKLLKHARFKLKLKVAKVDTGLRYEPNFDKNTRDYARQQQMNVVQLRGNTDIAERCYQKAKSSIRERIAEYRESLSFNTLFLKLIGLGSLARRRTTSLSSAAICSRLSCGNCSASSASSVVA